MEFFTIVLCIIFLVGASTVYGCDVNDVSNDLPSNELLKNDSSTKDNGNLNVDNLDVVSKNNDAGPDELNGKTIIDEVDLKNFNNASMNNVAIQNNSIISNFDNVNIIDTKTINDGTFDDLNRMIQDIKPGETLELDRDFFNTQDGHFVDIPINIDIDHITINGNYHTLDARNLSSFFYITAHHVTIINLNFINGYYKSDRYKYEFSPIWWAGDYGALSNCQFLGNRGYKGGAITWSGDYGIINNTTFNKNVACYVGGAIYLLGHDNTISNCEFKNSYSYVTHDVIYSDCSNRTLNFEYLNFNNELFTKDVLKCPEIIKYYVDGFQYDLNLCHLKKIVPVGVIDKEINIIPIIYASILDRYIFYNEDMFFYREYNGTDFILTFLRDFGGGVYCTKAFHFSNLTSLNDVFKEAERGDYKINLALMKSIVIHDQNEYENAISTGSDVFYHALSLMKCESSLSSIYKVLKIDFADKYTFDSKKTWGIKKSNFDLVMINGNGSKISVSSGKRDENWWAELSGDTSLFMVSNIIIEGFNMGIRNMGGACVCSNVIFNENKMDYWIDNDFGAGICNAGICICHNCIFTNNYCSYGAGIFNQGRLELYNCIFNGNIAYHDGSDVCNSNGGIVFIDGKEIGGSEGVVTQVSSLSASSRPVLYTLVAFAASALAFGVGSLVGSPVLGAILGAAVGAAVGAGGGALIISQTHDMNVNAVGEFTGVVVMSAVSGAIGGSLGSYVANNCPLTYSSVHFEEYELIIENGYPIHVPEQPLPDGIMIIYE